MSEVAEAPSTQDNRTMKVVTPLGKDVFLLAGFSGQEAISQLFRYRLDLLVEHKRKGPRPTPRPIPFKDLLGQSITVELLMANGQPRYFNGICARLIEGEMDRDFTSYHMEIVPGWWLLTRKAQSRIFQPPKSAVPAILKTVLEGLPGLTIENRIQGNFDPRDFCVQYRETDFNFASRLMEEEGIFYFFKHENGKHTLVLANTPSHPDLPDASPVVYENIDGGLRDDDRVYDWSKSQEVRAGKYTLRDYSFERPQARLQATRPIHSRVQAGSVAHELNSINSDLEIYDYPGEYTQRFDGVDKGGGDQKGELSKLEGETERTVRIRMEEEALASLVIQGASNCRQFVAGHKFILKEHINADGPYLLTGVAHNAREAGYRSGGAGGFTYHNTFTAIPLDQGLPFRPPRTTPKPLIPGTQTAFVVGSPGEEICADEYGRVKVQFHWDREGQNNLDSSCWIRVATLWAGRQWGTQFIPRVGHEVVVAFEEGDPDKPLIVGSVYNYDNMPPYPPDKDPRTRSGIKTRSTLKGGEADFNELRFEDKKGSEDVYFHGQKNFHRVVEHNDDLKVGNDQTITIKNKRTETVEDGDESVTIKKGKRTVLVETGDDLHQLKTGNRSIVVDTGNDTHQVKMGNREVTLDMGNDALTLKMGNQTTKLDLGQSTTEAMQGIELKVGQSSIKIDQTGITIKGMLVSIEGQVQTEVKGLMTTVKGDAMLTAKGGITMIN
ncbi:MAG: type VI secretion system tip protein VgrG [Gemmataceae bacterium]|nr:type VI secretion system tip protein VgrG [Gemmataceae bacterium]